MANRPKFCKNCGQQLELNEDISTCPKCGINLQEDSTPPRSVVTQLPYKSPGTAALIAIIGGLFGLIGLGHIYVGQVGRGIILLISGIVTYGIIIFNIFFSSLSSVYGGNPVMLMIIVFGSIGYFGLWIWQIFDARKLAKEFNQSVRESEKEPW